MNSCYGERGPEVCPLLGGCPFLGGSSIGGSTALILSPLLGHYFSESGGPPSASIRPNASSHTLCPVSTGGTSTESLPKFSRLAMATESRGGKFLDGNKDPQIKVTTKRTKFINPFDPSKVHGELTAYYRRWVHTFPRDKSGLAFQAHHTILKEDEKEEEEVEEEEEEEEEEGIDEEGEESDTPSSHTLSPPREGGGGGFGGRSWSDSREGVQEFRSLQQVGRRSYKTSMSSSYGETLVGSEVSERSVPNPESVGDEKGVSRSQNGEEERSKSDSQTVRTRSQEAQRRRSSHSQNLEPKSSSATHHHQQHRSSRTRLHKLRTKATPPRATPPQSKGVGGGAVWKKSGIHFPDPHHHAPSDPGQKKTVEDFTSIRRTGVDWKSLTHPACLPITVDFFPGKTKLEQEYYESPSKLVVSSYGTEVGPSGTASTK